MNGFRTFGMGAALVLISTAAFAFQEQRAGSPAPAAAPAPAASAAPTSAPAAGDNGLALGSGTMPAPSNGTEVRIPGLGRLGVLPKMDFGLELLYGATEQKAPAEAPHGASEDMTIRGSVKHRF